MLLLPADSTILVCTRGPLMLVCEYMGSVPMDGREALANIFSVRMGIRLDPLKLSEFVYSKLKHVV